MARKTKRPVEPCCVCGTTGGGTLHGRPQRYRAGRFKLDGVPLSGWLCRGHYQRLAGECRKEAPGEHAPRKVPNDWERRPGFVARPEHIAESCEAFRSKWSEEEERVRRFDRGSVEVRVVRWMGERA